MFARKLPVLSFQTTKQISFEQMLSQHKLSDAPIIRPVQTHSDVVINIQDKTNLTPTGDAVITNLKHVLLRIQTADCLPVLIAHPAGWIGAVHAGRVGTQRSILQQSLNQLVNQCGTNTNFHVWLGPCICVDCYEINRNPSQHFDLIEENTSQIYACLSSPQITSYDQCTSCHSDQFYSYRKHADTHRHYSCIINR